ncbi:MAG: response regulator [Thermoguttaceae bacterium]
MLTGRRVQILVADDHEMVRCGVKNLLAGSEITVVAEAATAQAAVQLALQKELDLVLLDVRMPDGDGLTVLGRIKLDKPDLPVLMFSAFDNPASVARAIALGASGFLLKDCTRDEFLGTIRTITAGESIWNREKLRSASRSLRTPRFGGSLEVFLSEREGEVLRLIAHGQTNKQISATMDLGCDTVKEQVQHIFRKIGLTDRTQAALWAVRNEWV